MAKKVATKRIPLSDITLDDRLQCRVSTDEPTVAGYAADVKGGASLPALAVFYDKATGKNWLADGRHTYLAHERLELKTVLCDVYAGGFNDALAYAAGANIRHGLRRTNADKRRAVERYLTCSYAKDATNAGIAKHCGVSKPLVASVLDVPAATATGGQVSESYTSPPEEEVPTGGQVGAAARKTGKKPKAGGGGKPTKASKPVKPDDEPGETSAGTSLLSDPNRATGEKIPAFLQGTKPVLRENATKEFRRFHTALSHLAQLSNKLGCYHGQASQCFTEILAAEKLLRAIIPTKGLGPID